VIHGWKDCARHHRVEAVRALEPYCDEFLYTHVDTEGLMGGTNLDAIRAVREATSRRVTAAGGITTRGNRRTRRASASTPSSAWPFTRER
jgi:phosphoribosylformimino-5-aminoimidazole carboxamide ribonucleotide (ProFAR) isomerase